MPVETVNDAALLESFSDETMLLLAAPPDPEKYTEQRIEPQPEWMRLRLLQHKREVSIKVDQVRHAESNVIKTEENNYIARSFKIDCKLVARNDIMDIPQTKENCAALEAYCAEIGQELTQKFLTKHLKFILAFHRKELVRSTAVAALDIASGVVKHVLTISNSTDSIIVSPSFNEGTTPELLSEFAVLMTMEELKQSYHFVP